MGKGGEVSAYYNENDPKAAAWLRELISAGHIAPGDVDERSILEVRPHELTEYTQQHFFAGIGGWSHALRLAGWPDSRPVRTGSCPCQPFSAAGRQLAEKDERHLWPWFRDLITFGEPTVTFGEQVASALGREWLSRVRADLEGLGYEVGAADLCAAGVSAPHIRQRLYWVANPKCIGVRGARSTAAFGAPGRMQKANGQRQRIRLNAGATCVPIGVGDTHGYHEQWWSGPVQVGWNGIEGEIERGGRKYRAQWRVKPGLSLLADGIPGRVDLCRGFGNAIVPQLAAIFIESASEVIAL